MKNMNLEKRNYSISIKGSKNFQSVSLTEGFEVNVDEDFNELDFTQEKELLKNRLIDETKKTLTEFVDGRKVDDDIDIDIDESDLNKKLEEDY